MFDDIDRWLILDMVIKKRFIHNMFLDDLAGDIWRDIAVEGGRHIGHDDLDRRLDVTISHTASLFYGHIL